MVVIGSVIRAAPSGMCPSEWWITSEATHHMSPNRKAFNTYTERPEESEDYIRDPSGELVKVVGSGTVRFTEHELCGVLYVPGLQANYLSLNFPEQLLQMCQSKDSDEYLIWDKLHLTCYAVAKPKLGGHVAHKPTVVGNYGIMVFVELLSELAKPDQWLVLPPFRTCHLTHSKDYFTSFTPIPEGIGCVSSYYGQTGPSLSVRGVGSVELPLTDQLTLKLPRVFYVPDVNYNQIGLGEITDQNGTPLRATPSRSTAHIYRNDQLIYCKSNNETNLAKITVKKIGS